MFPPAASATLARLRLRLQGGVRKIILGLRELATGSVEGGHMTRNPERLNVPLTVRMSAALKQRVDAAADAAGYGQGEWVRMVLDRAAAASEVLSKG